MASHFLQTADSIQQDMGASPVGPSVAAGQRLGKPSILAAEPPGKTVRTAVPDITPRERLAARPRTGGETEHRFQGFECLFGQLAIGRNLAPEYRKHRCLAGGLIDFQVIIAGDS